MEVAMSKLSVLGSALTLVAGCVASDDDPIIEDGIVEQAATVGASGSGSYTGTRIARVIRGGLTIEEGRLLPPGGGSVGLLLPAQLEDARWVRLRIDAVDSLPAAGIEVPAYQVSYTLDGQVWGSICGTPDNLAVVLEGAWDSRIGVPGAGGPVDDADHFTFACREAPLATCVELGYAPWRIERGVDLRDHHAACVRMLRADYCGDGSSWRDAPATLEVADALPIQTADQGWAYDATWSARGATCAVSRASTSRAPSCFAQLADCSPALGDTALLVSTVLAPERPTETSSLRGESRAMATRSP
jgi:hypothetical protein